MDKFTDWLKVQIKNPKFYIKLFAVILTFGILLMPKNTTFQSAEILRKQPLHPKPNSNQIHPKILKIRKIPKKSMNFI